MPLARKARRLPLIDFAMLTADGSGALAVQLADVSARGAAVSLLKSLPVGSPATLLFELDASVFNLPSRVVASRRDGNGPNGELKYRIGLAFEPLADDLRAHLVAALEALAERKGLASTPPNGAKAMDLNGSAQGCEQLFQLGVVRLAGGDLKGARDAGFWALKGDPPNPHFRAFIHRVQAEQALAAGRHKEASEEAARALTLSPKDPDIARLVERVTAAAPPRGRLARMFSR